MTRWFVPTYLTGKEFVKLCSVSKQYYDIVLSKGKYQHCDQGNLDRVFKKQKIHKGLYQNILRFDVGNIIVIHVKQEFLTKMRNAPDYPEYVTYWKLDTIGGPMD